MQEGLVSGRGGNLSPAWIWPGRVPKQNLKKKICFSACERSRVVNTSENSAHRPQTQELGFEDLPDFNPDGPPFEEKQLPLG